MLQTKNTYMRLVNIDDANFILSLRLNPKLNEFLSSVSSDVQEQQNWIIQYKEREKSGLDYYFIIVDKVIGSVGMVRIYDINYLDGSFAWGSWVLSDDRPRHSALDSMILSYDFAFMELGLLLCKFKVYTNNAKAMFFYERFGSTKVYQDDSETFFELTKTQYIHLKYNKYYEFLLR